MGAWPLGNMLRWRVYHVALVNFGCSAQRHQHVGCTAVFQRAKKGDAMLDTMSQGSSMRGLTQYISELRACGTRNAEQKRVNKEMAHIRLKFGPGARLDGYQRKKYVAKVLFTYLQGFKVDVGHTEAVQLMSSSKYSEKQIVRADTDAGLFGHDVSCARAH